LILLVLKKLKILKILKKICAYMQIILRDIIAPPVCFFCRDFIKDRRVFCKECSGSIIPIVSTTIMVAKKYPIKVFAISDYKDPIRSLILAKGYSDIVASRKLGELLWEMTYIKNIDFDYLVPIPLHFTRFASRGFNQAQEIARVLSQKSDKNIAPILKRTKITKRQSKLTQEGRSENVKHAFSLRASDTISQYTGKHLLLVDDLMTTGSTLTAAAKKLRELQPRAITAVVACRVV